MSTCLITGANRGIGLELARHYARAGATVLATARNPAAATELQRLKAEYSSLEILPLDAADTASIDHLQSALAGRAIDCLIANAGVIGPRGGMSDPANTAALWASVMAVNVSGVFFTVRAFAPSITATTGRIAIISSRMGSSTAAAGASYLYRASKAGAANLGVNFAAELKPRGIAVGVYHPGWVKTDMGGSGADITPTESAAGLARRIEHLSIATTGTFEDYAGAAIAY